MTGMSALALALSVVAFVPAAFAGPADEFEVVETRPQMEVVLIDADFLRPEDPSISIFGGTTQFLDGETILIELALDEPITSRTLAALKAEDARGEVRFSCDEATLYLANGTHVALAEGCVPAGQTEETP